MIPFPPPAAVRAMSRTKGFLAIDLSSLFRHRGGFGQVAEFFRDHRQYWLEREAKGALFAAGPSLPNDEKGEFLSAVLIIFNTTSLQEATHLADEDPMHRLGARRFDLIPWLLNHFSPGAASVIPSTISTEGKT